MPVHTINCGVLAELVRIEYYDLRKWMPDTGTCSHLSTCLSDMKEMEESLYLRVEVDIVKCTARGTVGLLMAVTP